MAGLNAMRWNPVTGESQIFVAAEDVPAGWLDHHPADPAKATATPPVPLSVATSEYTRKEIIELLEAGGVKFAKNASTVALLDLLDTSLRGELNKAGIEYPTTATISELLELIPTHE